MTEIKHDKRSQPSVLVHCYHKEKKMEKKKLEILAPAGSL